MRGWRRWAPVVLPVLVLIAGLAQLGSHLVYVAQHGLTRGVQVALQHSVLYVVVGGALTTVAVVAIRNADCDVAWRRAAWVSSGLTALVVLLTYAR